MNRSALDALLSKISDFILSRNLLVRIKHQEPSFKRIVVLYRIASHCFILLACSKVLDLWKDKQTPYIVDNLADRGVVPDLGNYAGVYKIENNNPNLWQNVHYDHDLIHRLQPSWKKAKAEGTQEPAN